MPPGGRAAANPYEAPGVKGTYDCQGAALRRHSVLGSAGSRLHFSSGLRSEPRTKHVSRLLSAWKLIGTLASGLFKGDGLAAFWASSYLRARVRGGASKTGAMLFTKRRGCPINRDSLPDVWCSGLSLRALGTCLWAACPCELCPVARVIRQAHPLRWLRSL